MTTVFALLFSQCNIPVEPFFPDEDLIAVYVQSSGDGGEIDPNAKIGKKVSTPKILPIENICICRRLQMCS